MKSKSTSPETILRRRTILSGEGNLISRIQKFLKECWAELKLTQRPTRKETLSYSVAVLVVILALAAYLAVLDFIFAKIFAFFYR